MICESSARVPGDTALVRRFGPVGLAGADHSAVRGIEIELELAPACGTAQAAQVIGAGLAGERCYKARPDPGFSMHEGDRLGIVRDRGGYFRVEFFQKQPCRTFSVPLWSEARLSTLCATASEGEALVREFLSAEHSTPSLGVGERAP
jgi:hypothetical protein